MNPVETLLAEPGGFWSRADPASEAEVAALIEQTRIEWPLPLINLWRFSNGGEGELALPPMWFALWKTSEVRELDTDSKLDDSFNEFQFFGTNGGLESIGLDLRKPPLPVFMIDLIAGVESLEYIAEDAFEFVNAIGLEYKENA